MSANGESRLPELLEQNEAAVLDEWVREQKSALGQKGQIKDQELRTQCADFLARLRQATRNGSLSDLRGPQWDNLRELLGEVSRSRGLQGFSPSETATFIFSLTRPL